MTVAVTARDGSDATRDAAARTHFDGFEAVRALAALMVVLHHASSLAGGRAGPMATPAAVFDGGVAVFFVLSGFLLYRPMVAADTAGGTPVRWRVFWWRRVLRIVPAYWLALTVLWAVGAFDLGGSWWRYYLFLQIYDDYTVFGGIVPAWSLCTEMAFYVVLPLFAWGVARVGSGLTPSRRLRLHAVACAALGGAGVVFRWLFDHPWSAERGLAFNWLPTNLDLFAWGMGLAVLSVALAPGGGARAVADRWATRVWPWWLAAGALFAWYAYRVGPTSIETGYTGWYWQQRQFVLGAFTVLVLVPMVFGDQSVGWARRCWRWRPIVWVGTVSYGLYLWHLDLMELAVEHGWLDLAPTAAGAVWAGPTSIMEAGWFEPVAPSAGFLVLVGIGAVAGLGCAALSWYGLERPVRRWRTLVGGGPVGAGVRRGGR